MAISEREGPRSNKKLITLCPLWQTGTNSSSSSSQQQPNHSYPGRSRSRNAEVSSVPPPSSSVTVSSVARSLLPPRRRLRLDPSNTGKQTRSAIKLKNSSKSHAAFKFQTTAPKSCYMRPPGGILAPGESIVATVFRFVEHPENNEKQLLGQKSKVKFKIMSLKVKPGTEYVPELFNEQKDRVTAERILQVVFLNVERPTVVLEKLNRQLAEAEAEAASDSRKKPPTDTGLHVVGEGLVIDEWKERREKYLARQQVDAVDSS